MATEYLVRLVLVPVEEGEIDTPLGEGDELYVASLDGMEVYGRIVSVRIEKWTQ